MVIHDFVCGTCSLAMKDVAVPSGTAELQCPACNGGVMTVSYAGWDTLSFANNGCSVDDKVCSDGTRSMMGAGDSKLCKIELGLSNSLSDRSLRTFSPEQQREFRELAMKSGKGARADRKVFDKIMETRKENLAKK